MKLKHPLIILNFKTYQESRGEKGLQIAKMCEEVSNSSGICIAVAPQAPDIYRVANAVDIPVFAQHIDGVGAGSFTGHVVAECVKEAGAIGTLINHSERRLKLAEIDASVNASKIAGLITVVCTNNVTTTSSAAALDPDYVAIEPPELIGTGIPVSRANPDIVRGSVEAVRKVNPEVFTLCGAGITTGEDFAAALALGSTGVLLASGIIKAKDQRKALENLTCLH